MSLEVDRGWSPYTYLRPRRRHHRHGNAGDHSTGGEHSASPTFAAQFLTQPLGGSELPSWYEGNRVQGAGPGIANPNNMVGQPPYDRMAEGYASMGANGFYRHVLVGDEDPWWPSSEPTVGGEELFGQDRYNSRKTAAGTTNPVFLPAGTHRVQDMAIEADANGQALFGYFAHQHDLTVGELHPEWVCHEVGGTVMPAPRGAFWLDISEHAGYRDVVLQRLLELAGAGVDGFYFDFFHMPRDGCFDAPIEAAFETATGLSAPAEEELDENNSTFQAWLDFHAAAIADTFAYWTDQLHVQYPNVVTMAKGQWLAGMTSRRLTTDLARSADVLNYEWKSPFARALQLSVFDSNPGLARPEGSLQQALSFTIARDSAGGRPPAIWEGFFPNEDHMRLFVSSVTAFGGIAFPSTDTEALLEDDGPGPHARFGYFTLRPVLEAAFHLGDRISPFMAHMRPERFAAVHFCEACRNARFVPGGWC